MSRLVLPFGFLAVDPLLPPVSLAYLALIVLLLFRRRGRPLAAVLLALLVALSLPAVGAALIASLDPPLTSDTGPPPGAIVILSADIARAAPPAPPDIGALTLERECTGASLAKRTGLPVLVTGGVVTIPPPIAGMMVASMTADFGVTPRWVEDRSLTTWENAAYSVPMLKAAGVTRVYLVTHNWHMRRGLLAFTRAGMDAVPVPVRIDPGPLWQVSSFIPRATAWEASFYAIHEWIGLLWYEIRR